MRLVMIVALAALSAFANATPKIRGDFLRVAKVNAGSEIERVECILCHVRPPRRNAFGRAVYDELRRQPGERVTEELIRALALKDSDGDGVKDMDEINQGSLPGDPASKTPNGGGKQPLIPAHSFHPLIIHFPIALFLFGAFLEFLGKHRGSEELRRAALWNLGFGAISSVVAVATGLVALFREGRGFEGIALTHLILGASSALCMVGLVLWRRKQILDTGLYWALLVTVAVLTGVAGHFGSMIVRGS
ncbi:MAG: DUF2231 domain-containing protein [Chthonomonas sp.]|nr:DUF2231 domain-containing protein [Chthonomonas sp.]